MERLVGAEPAVPRAGESLLVDLDLPALGYTCTERVASERITHTVLSKRAAV